MKVAILSSFTDVRILYTLSIREGRLRCSCPSDKVRICKHVLATMEAVKNAKRTGVFVWNSGQFTVTDEGRNYFNLSDNTGI